MFCYTAPLAVPLCLPLRRFDESRARAAPHSQQAPSTSNVRNVPAPQASPVWVIETGRPHPLSRNWHRILIDAPYGATERLCGRQALDCVCVTPQASVT